MLGTVWKLQKKLLGTKMDAFGTHVGGYRPSRAPLRFLKDVLYGLHGFAIEDTCSSLQETDRKNTFSHAAQNFCPRTQKEVPVVFKKDPKTLFWAPWRHPRKNLRNRSPKKIIFVSGNPMGDL